MDFQDVPCNLCGSRRNTVILRANSRETAPTPSTFACTNPHLGQHGTIVQCDECGLVFTNPRPIAEQIAQTYAEVEDDTYLAENEARVATFRHNLTGLKKWACSGRLLDVGCYVGTFLMVAQQGGFDAVGVEPSEWAARYARDERGLEVINGSLERADLPVESFDVVTMWDVIEHLTDPAEELRQIHRVLRPGGLLALTTMNVDSLMARAMRGRWPWYMLMHLYYFSPKTLSAMLEKAGFEVVAIEPHVRVVHLRYLVSKLEAYSPWLYSVARAFLNLSGLGGVRVPVYLGDLFTVYARRV